MTDLLSAPSRSSDSGPDTGTRVRVVLDTSVFVSDPDALFLFPNQDVVIPLTVIEELDGLKGRLDDVGRAARAVIRAVEALRVSNGGDIRRAVPVPDGGTVRIETNGLHVVEVREHGLDAAKADNRIIAAALGQARQGPTIVVSNDAALRIKAAQLGLSAKEHRRATRALDERPVGWQTVEASASAINEMFGSAAGASIGAMFTTSGGMAIGDSEVASALLPNEFAVLRNGSQSALVRRRGDHLVPLLRHAEAWGLRPRSKEQQFALDLLLDPAVQVVALDGTAGTGKTILALAAGLEQVMEGGRFDKMAVYRPVVPVGKAELGFLPGSLDEKLHPWMGAVTDALVALSEGRTHADAQVLLEEMCARQKLSLETVAYLRGRSLQGTYVLVDEAQNLEPTTLKTILTRVGEGTKVVFTGDTSQIDAPYLSSHNNAVAVLIDSFRGERCFGHVHLSHCERSEVASLAAQRL